MPFVGFVIAMIMFFKFKRHWGHGRWDQRLGREWRRDRERERKLERRLERERRRSAPLRPRTKPAAAPAGARPPKPRSTVTCSPTSRSSRYSRSSTS